MKKKSKNRKNGFLIQTTAKSYHDTGELLTLHEALELLKEIEKEDPYVRLIQIVDRSEI